MNALLSVQAQEAMQLLANDAVLVDVREPAEFNNLHIPNAKLHPLGSISASQLVEYGDKTVIVYCQKGIRGQQACEKVLLDNPNSKVVNLVGGIEAWKAAGFPTNKGTSKVLSLDRQVQITIGSLVLNFSLLAYFVHATFIFGAAFIGAGLLFAGISGTSVLVRILAKAPWNR